MTLSECRVIINDMIWILRSNFDEGVEVIGKVCRYERRK